LVTMQGENSQYWNSKLSSRGSDSVLSNVSESP
jgi:hypothetical protein